MLLDDIVKILVDGGHGTAGNTIVKGAPPEQPVDSIGVKVYGGSDTIHHMGGSGQTAAIERPRFQVVVRNAKQRVAWEKAEAIKTLLNGYEGIVNGVNYQAIFLIGYLGEIQEDGALAYRVAGSYEAKKDPS